MLNYQRVSQGALDPNEKFLRTGAAPKRQRPAWKAAKNHHSQSIKPTNHHCVSQKYPTLSSYIYIYTHKYPMENQNSNSIPMNVPWNPNKTWRNCISLLNPNHQWIQPIAGATAMSSGACRSVSRAVRRRWAPSISQGMHRLRSLQ